MELWRNKSALMRRAREIYRRADAKCRAEASPEELDSSGRLIVKVLFGMCLALAWQEFKDWAVWVSTEEASYISQYTPRQVRNWVNAGLVIGVILGGMLHVNVNSLTEYVDSLPQLDPNKDYIDSQEAASVLQKTTMTIRNWFHSGRLIGAVVKNVLYLERASVMGVAACTSS